MAKDDGLTQLAEYYGIQTSYRDAWEKITHAPEKTLLKILNLLGVAIQNKDEALFYLQQAYSDKYARKLEPVYVARDNHCELQLFLDKKELSLGMTCELIEVDNHNKSTHINIDLSEYKATKIRGTSFYEKRIILSNLSWGYHHLNLSLDNKQYHSFIISAPDTIYSDNIMQRKKMYGLFAPIYALHDQKTPDCGDLGTLSRLSQWMNMHGGEIITTMPFFAAFLNELYEISPYSPVSRLYWNELYLNLEALGYQAEPSDSKNKLVDIKHVAQNKRKYVEHIMKSYLEESDHQETFDEFVHDHPQVKDYALFRAYTEKNKSPWTSWNTREQQGALVLSGALKTNYTYHLFVQWLFYQQLTQFKKDLNQKGQLLYLDLPVGVHKDGYDSWKYQDHFIREACVGAPPDIAFRSGQNWQLPAPNPLKMRTTHYEYLVSMLRHIMPHVDVLRIDHVMGFNRLYWIPEGIPDSEGAYVKYNPDEIYAILCVESHRFKTAIVGENLGIVAQSTLDKMTQFNMLQMNVLQYQLDAQKELTPPTPYFLTSLNTHDMPTFSSYCQSLDIINNKNLNEIQSKKELKIRHKNLATLKETLFMHSDSSAEFLEKSLHFLAQSPAQLLLIQLEDLWQETQSQNVPGSQSEYNWCRQFNWSLEQIMDDSAIKNLLTHIKKTRINPTHNYDHPLFGGLLSIEDQYFFNEGTHYRLYEHLGSHCIEVNGVPGTHFAVWAPNAHYVSVIGNFNDWDKGAHELHPTASSGVWQGFIPEAQVGHLYKFYIESKHYGFRSERADPFAFYQEIAPKTASIIYHSSYQWQDNEWMSTRHQHQNHQSAISIYEMHIGSWQRVPEENNRFLTYREMAPKLAQYMVEMGFTHVELLPVMEHPFYGSWGYQTLGYFAPSARFGTPDDFKYFIDHLHQHQIGVILDWVPSHFPNDDHGLAYFDGSHLFEHSDPKKGFHPDWKSAIFNYGRHEVKAFLISSAMYWLDKFHIDAIRVDAVASMLYLDYSRKQGEWIPNHHGGNENLEAIQFLRELNETLYKYYPDIQTFAEESTAWPGVSRPTYAGGLGFGFKWDMGWMHDTLAYFKQDPVHRRYHHHELTFRMIYAFTENFTLSLSHDEVVYGKGSLINKMPGDEWCQFANLRLLYGYMYASPGKKLLFMGDEFAQRGEWSHEQSLDWHVLHYPIHQGMQQWIKKLNHVYQNELALHQSDHQDSGFAWIQNNDPEQSIFSFIRSADSDELIIIILNCTPVTREDYCLNVPRPGLWRLLASSDAKEYGGADRQQEELLVNESDYRLRANLPGLSALYYKWIKS